MRLVHVALVVLVVIVAGCGSKKQADPPAPVDKPVPGDKQPLPPTRLPDEPAAQAPGSGPAHALLDRYRDVIVAVGRSGTAPSAGLPELDAQLAAVTAAQKAGEMSAEVAARHERLVEVTRLMFVAFVPKDANRDAAIAEIKAWAKDVEAGPATIDPTNLAGVAPTLAAELVNEHMLIDGVTDRGAARAAYTLKYMPE